MRGDALAERAFARCRRTVDGDEHYANVAPSLVSKGTKSGKLVPIMLASSTVTG